MQQEVKKSVEQLVKKAASSEDPLKVSQAALNLSHVAQIWKEMEGPKSD